MEWIFLMFEQFSNIIYICQLYFMAFNKRSNNWTRNNRDILILNCIDTRNIVLSSSQSYYSQAPMHTKIQSVYLYYSIHHCFCNAQCILTIIYFAVVVLNWIPSLFHVIYDYLRISYFNYMPFYIMLYHPNYIMLC